MGKQPQSKIYDVFISYRHEEPDCTFAHELINKLENIGYEVAFDDRDFVLGKFPISEIRRCVKESRFTLAIISPRYLKSDYTILLSQALDINECKYKIIPLVLEQVEMPDELSNILSINITNILEKPAYISFGKIIDLFERLKDVLGPPNSQTQNNDPNKTLLYELVRLTGGTVQSKLGRFRSIAKQLKFKEKIFELITQPENQIENIFKELKQLLKKSLHLNDICMTILQVHQVHQNNETNKEKYKAKYLIKSHQTRRHTDPNYLINSKSTARQCLETREIEFHLDKFKAEKEGKYYISENDKNRKLEKGSIYCYPVLVSLSNRNFKDTYIISINTYNNKTLYEGKDPERINIIKTIFKETCRRIKLELILLSIKKWQSNHLSIFLCYNSEDKSEVKKIGSQLKEEGLSPWLDEWELQPGIPWQRMLDKHIDKINAAAVFLGSSGVGPWQQMELEAYLRKFAERNCPVIPVILPGASNLPELPSFLNGMTWVDFRQNESNPLERLIWGITGEKSL